MRMRDALLVRRRPGHVLQLDMVLVEVLNHANVVILDIPRLIVLTRH